MGADFLWRVSIATISASCPFSRFDNIDRTIAVLSGKGIRLSHPAGTTELTTSTPPYAFAGETPIQAAVIEGETTDLNAMSVRRRFRQSMQMQLASPEAAVRTTAHQSIIVVGGSMKVYYDTECAAVRPFDSLTNLSSGSLVTLISPESAPFYLIEFDPVG